MYLCTITDSEGCTLKVAHAVAEGCPIVINAYPMPISCTGQTTNIQSLYMSCGIGPFTYCLLYTSDAADE